MKTLRTVLTLLSVVVLAQAETRLVPETYTTIQAGIGAANHGDTVLVAEGTYVENINYRGKNIVVCSYYAIDGNTDHIEQTIIDGSQPANADTGSCVLIISGEDSTAQLIGFTLRGGTGTSFEDQSDHLNYVEGGGILIEESNPVIAYNVIRNNEATRRPAGVQSAGGGGIRAGYCAPTIRNNVIIENSGRYGGGVVFFFADPVFHNNVVAMNSGGQDYGGGGVWIGGAGHSTFSHNNDIVGNSSTLTGGGIRVFGGTMTGHSNIIWGNRANSGAQQVAGTTTSANLDYCCVQGGWNGDGNISSYPEFVATYLMLAPGSPCIDTGNPDAQWNDQDGTRCNMGYLGGPNPVWPPEFTRPLAYLPSSVADFGVVQGFGTIAQVAVPIANRGTGSLDIDSLLFYNGADLSIDNFLSSVTPAFSDTIRVNWVSTPPNGTLFDTLFIYHDDPTTTDPLKVFIHGEVADAAEYPAGLPTEFAVLPAFPNPFNSSTTLRVALPEEQRVTISIYDVLGREVTTLADEICAPGYHSFVWNARGASGSYVARVIAGKHIEEMVLRYIK